MIDATDAGIRRDELFGELCDRQFHSASISQQRRERKRGWKSRFFIQVRVNGVGVGIIPRYSPPDA